MRWLQSGRLLGRRGAHGGLQGFWGSLGQNLLDETWRHDRGEDRSISGLFDFKAVEERLYVYVCALRADAAFGGMK
jgi:hypothetical protein